jgi:hypothetical protein
MKDSKEPAVQQGQQNKPSPNEVKGAQPKILKDNPPAKGEQSQEVKEHNKDMDNRAEQAHESVSNEEAEKDKVPSGYWKGMYRRCIEIELMANILQVKVDAVVPRVLGVRCPK